MKEFDLEEALEALGLAEEVNEPDKTEKKQGILSSLLKWSDILRLNISTEYLLDKLIPKGAITLLFGRGGIGKTSLSLQIGKAIAEGTSFAGLSTTQSPVIYIDFENPLSILKERAEIMGNVENFYVWHLSCNPQPPRLDSKNWDLYRELPKGLIVFDTLRASHLLDENSSQDMALVISRLKELRELGFTILLLHHTTKGNEGIYKGSTAILDLADNVLGIEGANNTEDTVEFDTKNLYKFGIRIKTRYEPHHLFLRFNPAIKGFDVAKDPDLQDMEEMRDILLDIGKPVNQSEFLKIVKTEMNLSKRKFERLVKAGVGICWNVEKTKGRDLIYKPISSFPHHIYSGEMGKYSQSLDNTAFPQNPNPIYSEKVGKYSLEGENQWGNTTTSDNGQSLDNTAFPQNPKGGLGNEEIPENDDNIPFFEDV